MDQQAGGSSPGRPLDELLVEARLADPTTRYVDYRDAIAAHGVPAIKSLSTWILDPRDGYLAVSLIAYTGSRFGYGRDAIRALRAAQRTVDSGSIASLIESTLVNLGAKPPGRPLLPRISNFIPSGYQVAPAYRDAHHVVVDHVLDSRTGWTKDIYLFACRRFFTGDWVRAHGDLTGPAGRLICTRCAAAVVAGA